MSKALTVASYRLIALWLLALLLSGCASFGGAGGNQGQAKSNPWASQAPYEWPPYQQSDANDLALGPAPQALLAEADAHYEAGRSSASAASLERALRLAPRSPVVWYRLAGLRASQGDLAAANRLSEKASSLVTTETSPRIRQWLHWLNDWLTSQLRPAV
jgi:tetratricopeptide (TPR) repeat protein